MRWSIFWTWVAQGTITILLLAAFVVVGFALWKALRDEINKRR